MTDQIVEGGEGASPAIPIRQESPIEKEKEANFWKKDIPLTNLVVYTGMKGSTKTCNLVRTGMKAMISWKRPVFSDFPFGGDLLGNHYECEPLPDEALINYCQGLPRRPVIILDEMQEFFDRQEWYSVKSKQGVSLMQQIRKLGVLIAGACQFFNYLNSRITDQVDILIKCEDLYMSDWGDNEGISRGREAVLRYYDLSGAYTKHSARHPMRPSWIIGDPFDEELVFTEPYWRFFDTTNLTALEQRFKSYKIKKDIVEVPASSITRGPGNKGNGHKSNEDILEAVRLMRDQLVDSGITHVTPAQMLRKLKQQEIDVPVAKLGQILTEFGFPKRYTKQGPLYDLSETVGALA